MATPSRTKNRLSKAEQSRRTRGLIIQAATELFVQNGYLSTTMAAIARGAGVSVQTLYLSFRGKFAILHAALDIAVAGDDEPVPVHLREPAREGRASPDGLAALVSFMDITSGVIERANPLLSVIHSAAADPEVAELLTKNKRERHELYRYAARELSAKPGFTSELPVKKVGDVLYAVQSEQVYTMLVVEQGWSVGQWREWALRTVASQIFPGHASLADM